jgi:hypothetical protein
MRVEHTVAETAVVREAVDNRFAVAVGVDAARSRVAAVWRGLAVARSGVVAAWPQDAAEAGRASVAVADVVAPDGAVLLQPDTAAAQPGTVESGPTMPARRPHCLVHTRSQSEHGYARRTR